MKQPLKCVSVWQVKWNDDTDEMRNETCERKENHNITPFYPSKIPDLTVTWNTQQGTWEILWSVFSGSQWSSAPFITSCLMTLSWCLFVWQRWEWGSLCGDSWTVVVSPNHTLCNDKSSELECWKGGKGPEQVTSSREMTCLRVHAYRMCLPGSRDHEVTPHCSIRPPPFDDVLVIWAKKTNTKRQTQKEKMKKMWI